MDTGVANLVDRYLAAIYPNYFESTRALLLIQARDLLMCTFHADLSRFEREFLSPAAELIENVKNASCNLSVSVSNAFIYSIFLYAKNIKLLGVCKCADEKIKKKKILNPRGDTNRSNTLFLC